ncbi:MAG: ABC transporter permease [Phycisphaerae bacterium]|nr:ABC transporter permease [Phycisphaerae bacterium]
MLPTLVGITFLVFMLVALSPGGIGAGLRFAGGQMEASKRAQQEAYLEDRYGLDDPAVVQYARWLGRISPIKIGPSDLVAPDGETIRPPRETKPPPMWAWFAPKLPSPAAAVRAEGVAPADRASAYRRAAADYATVRAASIAANAVLQQALAEYARSIGRPDAVSPKGKIRASRLASQTPDRSSPAWPAAERAANAALAAYAAASDARARLRAAFDAGPYPKSGVAILPGVRLAWPDLGVSFSRGRPVLDLIGRALPVTLLLNLLAFPIIYLIAIPSGMLAATRRGSWFDAASGALFVALWSIPTVWAGVLAIGFLANDQYLGLFPVTGLHDPAAQAATFLPSTHNGRWQPGYLLDTLWHLALPVSCLVYGGFAVLAKQTRAAMLDNFNADYVRTAKAKGVAGRDIVIHHVFRNSLLPLITMFVTVFPATLAGSVVIESVFSIPGMGSLILDAINLRDRELILANTLMVAAVNLLALLLADVLYALADPRVSYA